MAVIIFLKFLGSENEVDERKRSDLKMPRIVEDSVPTVTTK